MKPLDDYARASMQRGQTQTTPESERSVTIVGPLPPPPAGVPIHNDRLVRALRQRGWKVTVLTNGRFVPNGRDGQHLGNSHLRHFVQVLRQAPDVMHIHDTRSSLTLAAVVAARLRRVPTVLTVHSRPLSFTGRKHVSRLRGCSLRSADNIIAVNDHIADDLRAHRSSTPLCVISPYIAPSQADVLEISSELDAWIRRHSTQHLISFAVYRPLGRFARRRDVYGLAIMSLFAERLSQIDDSVCLVMLLSQPPIGKVERSYLDSITYRMRRSLGGNFLLLVGESALPIIARSSVFIRPTTSDGDSISIREALDFGVPVVASDAIPRPPGTILYATADINDLIEKTREALKRPPRRMALDTPDNVSRVMAVYESVRRSPSG